MQSYHRISNSGDTIQQSQNAVVSTAYNFISPSSKSSLRAQKA